MDVGAEELAARIEAALDLAELAGELYEMKLRREQPMLSDEEIAARVRAWYQTRPGAAHGDAEGSPVFWPRGPR